jgi:hypothetical protein
MASIYGETKEEANFGGIFGKCLTSWGGGGGKIFYLGSDWFVLG